jgi:L-lactate dehydrogenase (cytochrome)
VKEDSNISVSVSDYFSTMLDQSMNWQDAADVRKKWGKQFCLKGIMSVGDAKRAVDIGATAIMVSNHGGRQLDGSRSPFDQLAEIVDAVGDKIDVICDGGITRGTHVLKALSVGAKACSGGRLYLYALAAAGQNIVHVHSDLLVICSCSCETRAIGNLPYAESPLPSFSLADHPPAGSN